MEALKRILSWSEFLKQAEDKKRARRKQTPQASQDEPNTSVSGQTGDDSGQGDSPSQPPEHPAVFLPLSTSLDQNVKLLQNVFHECSDIVFRDIRLPNQTRGMLIFIDGIVNLDIISDFTLDQLFRQETTTSDPAELKEGVISTSKVEQVHFYRKAVDSILLGNALLLVDGYDYALVINSRGGTRRQVEEPQSESVLRGPREGFTENISSNIGLLRLKLKSEKLKTITYTIGTESKTQVVLLYMEGIADPGIIAEAKRRLERIQLDAVLESMYIEELIKDNPYSPFPVIQNTERPDTVAAELLEGRFAIFVDGTPFVILAPAQFWQFLQTSEDYYERYFISTLVRWLRYVFLLISLYLPGLYVATITYHYEMMPTSLLLSVAAARESIPFPALVEALMMEASFEALLQAGIRLPRNIGQTVSILGAIVVGQSAVAAGIVSAPIVIIVSLTGIASFTIPRYSFALAIRMLRFPMIILGGVLGLFGIILGTVWMVTHLCALRSFGVPYMGGVAPYTKGSLKDILVKAPLWRMGQRSSNLVKSNRRRMRNHLRPGPNST